MTLFESQKVLILVTSKLFLIAIACTFGVTSKESFPSPSLKKFISMFYSDSFTVWAFTSKFMIDFELIFVYSMKLVLAIHIQLS